MKDAATDVALIVESAQRVDDLAVFLNAPADQLTQLAGPERVQIPFHLFQGQRFEADQVSPGGRPAASLVEPVIRRT